MNRRVGIRGLGRLAGWIFLVWGVLVAGKGFWDVVGGQPEANYFSPGPWQFVTREQWFRYAGFELCYGLACVGLAWGLWKFSERLPIWIEKKEAIAE
ncbi:MAG TPA: hypothetical protein PK876_07910 [Elusimicrobiota bacterium]|nr:hypothetical protein [Elusimicrobiota bacterium]